MWMRGAFGNTNEPEELFVLVVQAIKEGQSRVV